MIPCNFSEQIKKSVNYCFNFVKFCTVIKFDMLFLTLGEGARCVMVIVVGNGHGDTSSNPGRGWLNFIALIPLGKV